MYFINYKTGLKAFARQLRNHSTLGEVLLWKQLRAGQLRGYTFNRQRPIDRFIVDFYCQPLQLVIEVDGGYHYEDDQKVKDEERQNILQQMKLNSLRFHDDEIKKDLPQVLLSIEKYIDLFESRYPEVCGRR